MGSDEMTFFLNFGQSPRIFLEPTGVHRLTSLLSYDSIEARLLRTVNQILMVWPLSVVVYRLVSARLVVDVNNTAQELSPTPVT
jgi:hypothetical protein